MTLLIQGLRCWLIICKSIFLWHHSHTVSTFISVVIQVKKIFVVIKRHINSFKKIILFILAVLGLHCCVGFYLVAASGVHGLLNVGASLVSEHGFQGAQASVVVACGLSRCGFWDLELWHMGLVALRHVSLPESGIKRVSYIGRQILHQ